MTILPDRPAHEGVAFGDAELGQGLEVLDLTLSGLESLPD